MSNFTKGTPAATVEILESPIRPKITMAELFIEDQLQHFASHIDLLPADQAFQVVEVMSEMLRQIECRRQGMPI